MDLTTFNIVITMLSETKIISEPLEVGTRVHWDVPTQALYYVDVPVSKIYKYQPEKQLTTTAKVGDEPLGFAFPIQNTTEGFIAALGRKFVMFDWNGTDDKVNNIKIIGEVDQDLPANRINGGKVDPFGRLWAGTMGPSDVKGETIPEQGSLYSVDKGKIIKHDTKIGISNGLAWNIELKKMYYIDTLFKGVYQYDYIPENGSISNKQIIFKFADHNIKGSPDGMTIDEKGNLWIAVIYGSKVINIDPNNGKLLKTIELPTSEITAIVFGGKKLDTLFINTAKMPINGKIPEYPAGCTFEIENMEIKGVPSDNYLMN